MKMPREQESYAFTSPRAAMVMSRILASASRRRARAQQRAQAQAATGRQPWQPAVGPIQDFLLDQAAVVKHQAPESDFYMGLVAVIAEYLAIRGVVDLHGRHFSCPKRETGHAGQAGHAGYPSHRVGRAIIRDNGRIGKIKDLVCPFESHREQNSCQWHDAIRSTPLGCLSPAPAPQAAGFEPLLSLPIILQHNGAARLELALVDTGAQMIAIRQDIVEKMNLPTEKLDNELIVWGYEGENCKYPILCKTKPLIVAVRDHDIETLTFYVFPSLSYPIILGADWCKRHSPLTFCYDKKTIITAKE